MNCANACVSLSIDINVHIHICMWIVYLCHMSVSVCICVYVLRNIYSFFSGLLALQFYFCPFITFRSSFHHNNQFKHSQVHRKHTNAIYIEKSWTRLRFNIYILSYNNEWLLLILSSTKVPDITDLLWDGQMGLVYIQRVQ